MEPKLILWTIVSMLAGMGAEYLYVCINMGGG